MSLKDSTNEYVKKVWQEAEEPVAITLSSTLYFLVAILCLRGGTVLVYFLFSDKCWYNVYLEIMSVGTLIFSFVVFLMMRLILYFNSKRGQLSEIRRGDEP